MKLLMQIFFMLLLLRQAAAEPDATYGAHGMAVFGDGEQLFASHLPMFHPPHDHQLVMQIRLGDAAIDAQLRATLAHEPTLWTIDPEPFALRELWLGERTQFQAKLFRGHFERGGALVEKQVQVQIVRVLEHHALAPSSSQACLQGAYRVLDGQKNAFLFKQIRCTPDFDHLVRIQKRPGSGALGAAKTLAEIRVTHEFCKPPADTALAQALAEIGIAAHSMQSIYFETGDLQCR